MGVAGENLIFKIKNNNNENKQNGCQNSVPIYIVLNDVIIKNAFYFHQITVNDI